MLRRSRLPLPLLASVLLHAVALLVLSRVWSTENEPRVPAPQPLELEIVYAPQAQPPAQASAPPARKVPRSRQPAPVAPIQKEPDSPASSSAPEQVAQKPEAPPPAEQAPSLATDAPRAPPRLTLLPQHLPGGVPVVEEPPSRGRTLQNRPEEVPDPQVLAEYQAEEARARIQGMAEDTLATARANRGVTPPYFRQLQRSFAEQLVDPPSPDVDVLAKRMVRDQIDAIQRFGKTGSPVVAPEQRDHRLEQQNRIQAAAEAGRATNMYMVDVTAPVLALAAVVEVWQEPDGKLRGLKLLMSSGDPTFDSWAVSRLRHAFATVSAPPDAGVGIHDSGLRTRWRLEEYLGNPRVQIHLIGIY
ncbi:ferrichrome ABC transporter substrate-binding protein [Hyalangium minutum]|uniref:ferrichrome ABC transporter substrate-binding protein n=1 Tax=Hyalangium minutum TaxID=394096 RepID=UPI001F0AB303|nr:ferrichrome ABC transporter substrate-binding protein [Hyalangium minutum]